MQVSHLFGVDVVVHSASFNIRQVTTTFMYIHCLKKCFLDQSIQKTIYLISKTESLVLLTYLGAPTHIALQGDQEAAQLCQ